jgi:PAS domain S-box-containing protein
MESIDRDENSEVPAREADPSRLGRRRIFEASPDLIAVTAGTGEILDLNPSGRKMLGLPQAGSLSEKLFLRDFLAQPDDWQDMTELIRAHGCITDAEILMKRSDGSHFSVILGATSEEDRYGGHASPFLFLVKDVSHRKAIENQLLQADKLASIGQLAAGIAHEINNPLSMILGYTQLLLRNEKDGTQRYADLRIIEKHTRTCKTIVEDLLNFARSARTKKAFAHIHAAMESVLSVVQHHLQLDGITVEKDFDDCVPPIVMDGEKIKQVFMNLIMNAKQAIGERGVIRVRTRYDEMIGRVAIQVSDSGSGIDPRNITRIFDPFFTTKATGEGTGLGLSVSYGIVKEHGGEIVVESILGKGSTFTVTLPAISEGSRKK